ncbi:DUF3800 domain-containing protein [Nocardiopsis metallicus]|nr:DUF3800 domain-containing protein [Nocardiopsis metallicus]
MGQPSTQAALKPAPKAAALLGTAKHERPLVHVFVDETGDRGFSTRSSPFFAMTALMVPHEAEASMRCVAGGLRYHLNTTKPLHWVEHFKAKRWKRRQLAAEQLSSIPGARVVHVVVEKASVRSSAGMRKDSSLFYNYVTRLTLERVAYAAENWPSGPRFGSVRFGSVAGLDSAAALRYLTRIYSSPSPVPWDCLKWPPVWRGTEWDGIQLADIHAGILNSALTGDVDDPACAAYLLEVRHQLQRSNHGQLFGYGLKVLGDPSYIRNRCWWPDLQAVQVAA